MSEDKVPECAFRPVIFYVCRPGFDCLYHAADLGFIVLENCHQVASSLEANIAIWCGYREEVCLVYRSRANPLLDRKYESHWNAVDFRKVYERWNGYTCSPSLDRYTFLESARVSYLRSMYLHCSRYTILVGTIFLLALWAINASILKWIFRIGVVSQVLILIILLFVHKSVCWIRSVYLGVLC